MSGLSRADLLSRAILLSYLTIAWNVLAGSSALVAAAVSGSLALAGLALNQLIDTSASVVLVWRFKHEEKDPDAAAHIERIAEIAIAFAMLVVAAFISYEAITALIEKTHPGSSTAGVILAVASLLVLPPLARMKFRVAAPLRSRALRADAVLTAASAALAAVTLAALAADALFGWWWCDRVAALIIAATLVSEAVKARHAETFIDPVTGL